jgi:hypothetical protein
MGRNRCSLEESLGKPVDSLALDSQGMRGVALLMHKPGTAPVTPLPGQNLFVFSGFTACCSLQNINNKGFSHKLFFLQELASEDLRGLV